MAMKNQNAILTYFPFLEKDILAKKISADHRWWPWRDRATLSVAVRDFFTGLHHIPTAPCLLPAMAAPGG